MKQHRLLVLGTLDAFVLLVKKAKERGIYTIVCDGYANGAAREFADEDYVIPVTEIDEIAKLCKERDVDGIITSFSDLLTECMVKIADKAGIPCYLKPDQLKWYRDKAATRQLLEELGLPSPKHKKINKNSEITLEMIQDLSFPMVTKPLDRYGSRGVFVAENLAKLNEYTKKAADFTGLNDILIEEYNSGYEFNMMTYVLDGKVQIISIADREKTQIGQGEIPISTRNVYPSCLRSKVWEDAKNLLQKYVDSTKQTEGPLSMQFFWNEEKGIQVCEIAARFFGYEHELVDMVFGFNMEDLLLNYLFDKEALKEMFEKHHFQEPKQHGAVLYFHGRLLPIKDQSVAYELSNHEAVQRPWVFYSEGESVISHGRNPYVALYYITAPTREELDRISQHFFDTITIKSTDGQEVLYKNEIPKYPDYAGNES